MFNYLVSLEDNDVILRQVIHHWVLKWLITCLAAYRIDYVNQTTKEKADKKLFNFFNSRFLKLFRD